MNERINEFVEEVFIKCPPSKRTKEIKEELLANLNDKYNDLILQGFSEDEAFWQVIDSIGDIEELLGSFAKAEEFNPKEVEISQKKHAFTIAAAIFLYIFSLVVLIVFSLNFNSPITGLIIMLTMAAVATGLLVYNTMMGPKYKKKNDTFVENYKENVSDKKKDSLYKQSITSILWVSIVLIYMWLNYSTHKWYITWIIFVAGAVIQNIVELMFAIRHNDHKKIRGFMEAILWTSTTVIYLYLSFWTMGWWWTWVVFLIAVIIQQLARMFMISRTRNGS